MIFCITLEIILSLWLIWFAGFSIYKSIINWRSRCKHDWEQIELLYITDENKITLAYKAIYRCKKCGELKTEKTVV